MPRRAPSVCRPCVRALRPTHLYSSPCPALRRRAGLGPCLLLLRRQGRAKEAVEAEGVGQSSGRPCVVGAAAGQGWQDTAREEKDGVVGNGRVLRGRRSERGFRGGRWVGVGVAHQF